MSITKRDKSRLINFWVSGPERQKTYRHICNQDKLRWASIHFRSTLYGQKYWDTPLNYWIQVFHSDPLPQVYKMKHLAMKPTFTNICEKMGLSEEHSEFKHSTVIECHLYVVSLWNFIPGRYSMVVILSLIHFCELVFTESSMKRLKKNDSSVQWCHFSIFF